MKRTTLATVGAAFLIGVIAGCGQGDDDSPAVADSAHLSRSGKWMVDSQGRVVISHGMNLTQKSPPYFPDWLKEEDVKFLANQGFNVARVDFVWKAAEPQPGVYDDTYIRHVLATNQLLAKYGIRTLLDFHQNGWNARAGAPDWATFTGPVGTGQSAFQYPFQAFWDDRPASDGVGIQTHFVRLWAHIAKRVNESPAADSIIGFDPFNEPSPGVSSGCAAFGAPCPAFEAGALTDFYKRVIAAVRATGSQHVIWPNENPSGGAPTALGPFDDPQVGFNPHYYCSAAIGAGFAQRLLTPTEQATCQHQEEQQLPTVFANGDHHNVPTLLSEFGCSDDPDDTARMVAYMGQAFVSWAHWMYPSTDVPATGPCPGLVVNKLLPPSLTNVKLPRLMALTVPYAQAISGTPTSTSFAPSTRIFTMTYSAQSVAPAATPFATTRIFVPQLQYPQGYLVEVSGARVTSSPTAAWVQLVADSSNSDVEVTIKPNTGSFTDVAFP